MIDLDALLAAPLGDDWSLHTTSQKGRKAVSGGSATEAALARAHALASRMPPSVADHGGDEALLRVSTELATILGEDAAAIETVLTETFNPRCVPEWDAKKIKREAQRAAGREASPDARLRRRRAARHAAREEESEDLGHTELDPFAYGEPTDWTRPPPKIAWLCEGLGIAPSERKVTLIGGQPGAGKGPLAGYLAACIATGRPVFDLFPVKRSRVLYLDFEGRTLSDIRIRSHLRGMGARPEELGDRLLHLDAAPRSMLDLGWLRSRIENMKIGVVIIDSYTSASIEFGAEANSPEFAYLAQELGALGIVVIIVAHARTPKSGQHGERPALADIAGSGALAGYAQTAIAVWTPDEDDKTFCRVGCMRAPGKAFETLDVRWEQTIEHGAEAWAPRVEGSASVRKERASKVDDANATRTLTAVLDLMLSNPAHPHSVNGLARNVGQPTKRVGQVMSLLHSAGLVVHIPDPRGVTSGAFTLDAEILGDSAAMRTIRSLHVSNGELTLTEEDEPSFTRPSRRRRK